MTQEFQLDILTPDRQFFGGAAEELVVTTTHGEMGFLKNAMPLVASLTTGVLKLKQNGRWMEAVTGEGFIEVGPKGITVLVFSAEWPYEIKIKEVEDEIDRLSEDMKKQKSLREYKMVKAQLARQFVKLKVKKHIDD